MWLIFSASAISWQLTWWSCSANCKISSTFPVTGRPKRGASWHPNLRNEIEQTTSESFVHWQHFHHILHKIFSMFLRISYLFYSKKHLMAYYFRYFNHCKINKMFYTCNDLKNYLHKICMLKCHLLSVCTFDTRGWV